MTTVKNILDSKGYDVYHIHPETTVYEALQLMAEKEIGAVIVVKDEKVEGVFSERDYVRGLVNNKEFSQDSPVCKFMTKGIITVKPVSDLFICMMLMTDMKVRHLPVIENEKIIGIISIGDVVNSIIQTQKVMIKDLESYIAGDYGLKQ